MHFIKRSILFLFLALGSLGTIAQNNSFDSNRLYDIASSVKFSGDWVRFKPEKFLSASNIFKENKYVFGLTENDNLRLVKVEDDELGMTHYRFQQLFKSIPVDGAEYFIHAQNGIARSGNGRLYRGINIEITPAITPPDAIQKAIEFINAKSYLWEDEGAEQMLKNIRKDPFASFYPSPELVITPINFSDPESEKKLAYKMDIHSYEPLAGKTVYIDAITGQVLFTLELIHTGDVPATAITKYSGSQNIVTDSVSSGYYRLREAGRAAGIETLNMQQKVSYGTAVDFSDNNNYWDTINSLQDEAAPDAHWATEMTYDYFLQNHNRNSFDNQGAKLVSYVHFASNYINAFWNGSWMTYGDGNGTSYKALTSIDIGGHEITHGVTQNSAGLVYKNESGALNESFSDIFGACVEFFAKPSDANWLMAEDIGTPFRSMSNPNLYGDPDTYKGALYYNGTADNGGVHTNSGVQNFWFYILTVGDTGVNDFGKQYQVPGLGMNKAARIAYRNLTVYMGKNSRFIDAREGAISAAEDLYGMCSDEVFQTANAWYAVGVGDPIADHDIRLIKVYTPSSKCGLTNSESISFLIRNRGCITISGGDTVFATFRVDTFTVMTDTVLLPSPMAPGDSLYYTFTKPADLSATGLHVIDGWIRHNGDTLNFNDSVKSIFVTNKLYQNTDIAIQSVQSPKSGCILTSSENISIKMQYRGCDSLSANEQVVFAFRINAGPAVRETLALVSKIAPNGVVNYTFNTKADLSAYQFYYIDCWVEYAPDTVNGNDSIFSYRINKPYEVLDSVITFEDTAVVKNLFYAVTNSGSQVYVQPSTGNAGTFGCRMTGKDWLSKRSSYKTPTDLNIWTANNDFLAQVCVCVDARQLSNIMLHFDRRQTCNSSYSATVGYNTNYTSNLRVTVDGVQVSNTYNPDKKVTDPWVSDSIVLDTYAGTFFTLCFETKNYVSANYETYTGGVGDNAFLDNIYFTGIVKPEELLMDFTIYPNPANDNFTILYGAEQAETINIKVIDILGRVITDINRNIDKSNNHILMNSFSMLPGVYFIQLQSDSARQVRSLVIE